MNDIGGDSSNFDTILEDASTQYGEEWVRFCISGFDSPSDDHNSMDIDPPLYGDAGLQVLSDESDAAARSADISYSSLWPIQGVPFCVPSEDVCHAIIGSSINDSIRDGDHSLQAHAQCSPMSFPPLHLDSKQQWCNYEQSPFEIATNTLPSVEDSDLVSEGFSVPIPPAKLDQSHTSAPNESNIVQDQGNPAKVAKKVVLRFTQRQKDTFQSWLEDHLDDPYPSVSTIASLRNLAGLQHEDDKRIRHWFSRARQRNFSQARGHISTAGAYDSRTAGDGVEPELERSVCDPLSATQSSLDAVPGSVRSSLEGDRASARSFSSFERLGSTGSGTFPALNGYKGSRIEWWTKSLPEVSSHFVTDCSYETDRFFCLKSMMERSDGHQVDIVERAFDSLSARDRDRLISCVNGDGNPSVKSLLRSMLCDKLLVIANLPMMDRVETLTSLLGQFAELFASWRDRPENSTQNNEVDTAREDEGVSVLNLTSATRSPPQSNTRSIDDREGAVADQQGAARRQSCYKEPASSRTSDLDEHSEVACSLGSAGNSLGSSTTANSDWSSLSRRGRKMRTRRQRTRSQADLPTISGPPVSMLTRRQRTRSKADLPTVSGPPVTNRKYWPVLKEMGSRRPVTLQNSSQNLTSEHDRGFQLSQRQEIHRPVTIHISAQNQTSEHNGGSQLAQGQEHKYQCTFCNMGFSRKSTWQRHESAVHLTDRVWVCKSNGLANGGHFCAVFGLAVPCLPLANNLKSSDCQHRFALCWKQPKEKRTFYRRDNFKQHLTGFHKIPKSSMIADFVDLDDWKEELPPQVNLACGFCGQRQPDRTTRTDHIAQHFESGMDVSAWRDELIEEDIVDLPLVATAPKRDRMAHTFRSALKRFSNIPIHSSAMPPPDTPVDRNSRPTFPPPPAPAPIPEVLFTAASVYEFNIDRSRREAGFPYLTYVAGEIFDIIGERGELWLAKNQDDPKNTVGWIWNKHFAKLAV